MQMPGVTCTRPLGVPEAAPRHTGSPLHTRAAPGSTRLSQALPQLFCPPCPTQNGFLQGRTEARIRAAPGITGKRGARDRRAGPVGRGGDSRAHGSEEHTGQVAGESHRGQTLSTSPGQGPVQVLDLCKVRR